MPIQAAFENSVIVVTGVPGPASAKLLDHPCDLLLLQFPFTYIQVSTTAIADLSSDLAPPPPPPFHLQGAPRARTVPPVRVASTRHHLLSHTDRGRGGREKGREGEGEGEGNEESVTQEYLDQEMEEVMDTLGRERGIGAMVAEL